METSTDKILDLRGPSLRGLDSEEGEHGHGHVVIVELLVAPLPISSAVLGTTSSLYYHGSLISQDLEKKLQIVEKLSLNLSFTTKLGPGKMSTDPPASDVEV